MDQANPKTTQDNPINLEPNIAAAISYLIFPITGILFLFVEKKDSFVGFHAAQSTVLGIIAFLLRTLIIMSGLGLLLFPIYSIAIFLVWAYMLYTSYSYQTHELPVVADLAKKLLSKL